MSLFLFCAVAGCGNALPTRDQSVGNCAQESDCGTSGQACVQNQCVPCSAHSDCQSQVCDSYGDLGGVGKCVPQSNIVYVDSNDANLMNCTGAGVGIADGSMKLPYCDLPPAVMAAAAMPGKVIRALVSPTVYQLPTNDMLGGSIVLVGSGAFSQGKATSLGFADTSLQLVASSKLVIDGFSLSGTMISTTGATLTIRRTQLSSLPQGISITSNSTLTMDRDFVTMTGIGFVASGSTLNITNSFFAGNKTNPSQNLIDVTGGTGSFQFNTIAYNMLGSAALALNCTGGTGLMVKNSILVQNEVQQELAQSCSSVPGSLVLGQASKSPAGQIDQDPGFVNPGALDLRLNAFDAVNNQYVIDKATAVNPMDKYIDHDFFGTPRPQGNGYDIGAYEYVPQ